MLSDDEYSRCVETLRTRGYIVYHEKTDELEGRRIFCEFSKEPKPLRVTGRQQVLISSKIAVAVISCPEQKSGIYSMSERWVKNPNNPSGT